MNPQGLEVLSALVDGEAVDPAELAEALAHPDAREVLVDFARLRSLAAADDARPSPRFYTRMERGLGAEDPRATRRSPRFAALAVAAVLLVGVGLAAGLFLQPAERSSSSAPDRPPSATREITFTPGVDWFRS